MDQVKQEQIQIDPVLDKKITPGFLIKFAIPTIISMMVGGISGLIDGIFAARFIDATALAAVGLVSPFIMFVLSLGFMLGVGGNALIGKEIGEGKIVQARKDMTLITLATIVAVFVPVLFGAAFPNTVLRILGVDSYVHEVALGYMMPLLPFLPLGVVGMILQQFMITEGKAHYAMIGSFAQGVASAVLNYVFIYLMHMGIHGAALATGVAWIIPAFVCSTFLFLNRFRKNAVLYFVLPTFRLFAITRSAINGLSEMVGMLAASITQLVLNNILMALDGAMAVAAIGIILAASGLAMNIFVGYSAGIAPIVSYNYGKDDEGNLKKLFRYSMVIVVALAALMSVLTITFTGFFLQIYDIDPLMYFGGFLMNLPLYDMASTGLILVSITFPLSSIVFFSSTFFTAFNDGIRSGFIAFCNGLFFLVTFALIFSRFWGVDGVWIAMPARDIATVGISLFLLWKYRKHYKYA